MQRENPVIAARGRAPHPIDRHVGMRMRLRRIEMRLSQSALAAELGVTFQAVQKYEAGAARITVGRLYDASRALLITPAFFFDGFAGEGVPPSPRIRDEIAALLRGYSGIRDARLQTELRRLIATLGTEPLD